jgi:hypothetical protein
MPHSIRIKVECFEVSDQTYRAQRPVRRDSEMCYVKSRCDVTNSGIIDVT